MLNYRCGFPAEQRTIVSDCGVQLVRYASDSRSRGLLRPARCSCLMVSSKRSTTELISIVVSDVMRAAKLQYNAMQIPPPRPSPPSPSTLLPKKGL